MRTAFVYHPGLPLSAAELTACRLDGLLHEVGDGYLPADIPESAAARAASLALLLRPELAAAGPSAAWIHGAGDAAPVRHHARPATRRRLRAPSTARLRVHETVVADGDLITIGGIGVVGPVETLIDLARGMAGSTSGAWLSALAQSRPGATEAALARLHARRRLPGKHAAVSALERAYEDVTRYTS
ncbi:type IV toxin-antitoxin system AbiEi family antitoxin [Microbacterium tumbae]